MATLKPCQRQADRGEQKKRLLKDRDLGTPDSRPPDHPGDGAWLDVFS